ncbi:MAG TPA: ATP-binding protein [Luteibacter sp.]|uniref:ATP-binding protein n=1 Tax=Luteibacter sp. TaxID=1886636 RepID=UPI002BCB01D5|nr:ATP-binding protein [Luteibacter sp.]HVI57126.1 ATP-binding protein [Luteibacter sp.]
MISPALSPIRVMFLGSYRSAAIYLLLMGVGSMAVARPTPAFTPEERRWIEEHPVLRFTGAPNLAPIEMTIDGRYEGVAADYLEAIARQSGLRFQFEPVSPWSAAERDLLEGRIDLIPNVSTWNVSDAARSQLSRTEPYFFSATVIVTRSNSPVTSSLAGFSGQTIAVQGDSAYAAIIEERYPTVALLPTATTEQSLAAVIDGRAAAAVGPSTALVPFLRRQFAGRLGVSGALDGMPLTVEMGVRRDNVLLYSIIRKSLASLTAAQTDQIEERALDQIDYGAPSLLSIAKYRAAELATLGVCIALLVLFASRARAAHRRAEQSELAKSRFLAIMSHEIRTPMNAVIASVEMLRRTPLDARQDVLTDTASTAAEALLGLLDDVLDLSRLDAGHLPLERIPTDVGTLAARVVGIVRATAHGKALSVEVRSRLPVDRDALIDPTRLQQVLLNLLTNALKFTERGSITVKVETSVQANGPANSRLAVEVIDTGVGIPLAQQGRLFHAYTQADSSTTRRYGGTGLGLTICKELVELMGGDITLDSTPGAGTRVRFTLPVEWVERERVVAASGESTVSASLVDDAALLETDPPTEPGNILFVDDHSINRFVVAEQLRELGVTTVTVSGGDAALKAVEDRSFALVLMDCHMPDMDGYETTRQIRQREVEQGWNRLPIIALSAATDAAHHAQCIRSGMDDVLEKPLRLDRLRGMLETWIGPLPSSPRHPPAWNNRGASRWVCDRDALQDDVNALAHVLASNALRDLTHRLKGAACVAGYDAIGELAHQLETLIEEQGSRYHAQAATLVEALRAEVAELDAD